MCEITNRNFRDKLPEIRQVFEKSKFISLDLEFSALNPVRNQYLSLFDTAVERYEKLKRNLEYVIPLQVGLTAFQFDPDKNCYDAEVFTFYVAPVAFSTIDKTYLFQASSVKFLCLHKFDFNKFAYFGIPYLNSNEENELRTKITNNTLNVCSLRWEFDYAINSYTSSIEKWYNSAKIGDYLEIPEIYQRYKEFYEILYFLHKYYRERFKDVWTFIENDCFFIRKITNNEFIELSKTDDIDNDLIENLLGFRIIFNLLKTLKKPLIGHNLIQDLMIMFNCFEQSLPKNYEKFKTLIHDLFPIIFDTKTIYYELRSQIPTKKLPNDTSLSILFDYFHQGFGSEIVWNVPQIICNLNDNAYKQYHEAGVDSFCTGYIFLRMAYINIAPKYPETKQFVPSEIIASLDQYRNRLNIIRGSTSYIVKYFSTFSKNLLMNHFDKFYFDFRDTLTSFEMYRKLDGADPDTNRPPWLIIESINHKPLNLNDLSSMLGTYGSVDIKMISSSSNKRALVAVDTSRTAKDIFKHFKNNREFRIIQYNIFKHSTIVQICVLGGLTLSGCLLILYSYKS